MYSTVGFDVVSDREELLKIFQYNFKPNSPQLALWDADKNMVSGINKPILFGRYDSECKHARWEEDQ